MYLYTHIYIADMRTKKVSKCTVTKRLQLKSRLSMAFQPLADSFGIHRLGFKCSWWHRRQANDAVASERNIFSENHDYNVSRYTRTYLYFGVWMRVVAENYEQTHTDTHTHTQGTTTVTLAVRMRAVG